MHPIEMTPTFGSLISNFVPLFDTLWKKTIRSKKLDFALTHLAAIVLLLGMRHLGWLQPLELAAFDFMIRLDRNEGSDPRLLIVEITEQDIQQLKQYPVSDRVLAKVLGELKRHDPIAIGVDLVRNVPIEPGHGELVAQMASPKVIAIANIGNTEEEAVTPPPGVSQERVGFSDVVIDPDNVVRRNFMLAHFDENTTLYSFSLRLAFAYLQQKGIQPQFTKTKELQLGQTVFKWLTYNSGGYQNIDDGGRQILLNYRSARHVARQVSLTQVLKGQINSNWVKDKIVLIGATAPTAKDLFYTPYSRTERGIPRMAGVLIHAQMVSQVLSAVLDNRPLFWYWSEWLELLWIAGWSSLGGLLVARSPNLLLMGLSGITCLSVLFGVTNLLFIQGAWIPLAAPALGFMITGTVVEAYQRQLLKRQEQMVMRLLGQQTSPEIAEALWKERTRLLDSGLFPGQRVTATILLTDIKGFSTISEKMPPEEVMAWLNEYMPVMVREVRRFYGIVNKFTGDGLLAVFGVPVPAANAAEVGEYARCAVACALAMGDRLKELNQDWKSRGLPVVQIRIGIYTGPVMVGSLGGKERLEYGVIGDSVNIAARLESCEKERQLTDCRILIARETLIHLQDQFQVEAWGALQLKGKRHSVEVYRVLGPKD
jgi:adenylate cyclase